jgi:prevent-host-death family protein
MKEWQLQEAKAKFSEVVECALKGEKQLVTKRGEKAVVVMAYEDYQRLENKDQTLWDVFKTAPRMDEDELPLKRDKTPIKPFVLE